jgi:hypothetical protein
MLKRHPVHDVVGLGVTVLLAALFPLVCARSMVAEDVFLVAFGAAVAALFALRLWSLPLFKAQPVSWWLWIATGTTLIGAALWALDVFLGYVVQPTRGLLASFVNPMAALVSAAFFPLGAAIGVGSAVRTALSGAGSGVRS